LSLWDNCLPHVLVNAELRHVPFPCPWQVPGTKSCLFSFPYLFKDRVACNFFSHVCHLKCFLCFLFPLLLPLCAHQSPSFNDPKLYLFFSQTRFPFSTFPDAPTLSGVLFHFPKLRFSLAASPLFVFFSFVALHSTLSLLQCSKSSGGSPFSFPIPPKENRYRFCLSTFSF